MIKRRSRPRRSGRVLNPAYLQGVRELGYCAVAHASPSRASECEGPLDPDHMGDRPVGRKADDDTAVPMCRSHHRERTDMSGSFRGMTAMEHAMFRFLSIKRTRTELIHLIPEERRSALDIAAQAPLERPGLRTVREPEGSGCGSATPGELRSSDETSRTIRASKPPASFGE